MDMTGDTNVGDLRQLGPGTSTLSPSSQTAWITFSIASVVPAVRTICSPLTAWTGLKYVLKNPARAFLNPKSPPLRDSVGDVNAYRRFIPN